MEKKSLGLFESPNIILESFSGSNGSSIIRIETATKVIRIKFCVWGVRMIVDIAREIVGRQRQHAMGQWSLYKNLEQYTGYKDPENNK